MLSRLCPIIICLLIGSLPARGADAGRLPDGPGLAAGFPADAGIDKAPGVLFATGFEAPNLGMFDDYDGNKPPKVRLVRERTLVHHGLQSVQLEASPGKGAGADLVKMFNPGHDRLHVRFYTRFATDFDQGDLMHFVHVAGIRDRNQLGRSGEKPDGTDFFSTGLEPWRNWHRNPAPGAMGFYTYFPDMKRDPSGPFYGNEFRPKNPPVLVERGRWTCMEMMVQVNHPDRADGEQAFWIDGQLKGRYTGIRWRTTDRLKLNALWVLLYIHDNKQVNRVWFDDLVVATRYIGPMQPPAADRAGTAPR